jgi:hypothetical protein
LFLVPPAQRLNFNAELFQCGFGLFDLNLFSPVCKSEGKMAVKENLHHDSFESAFSRRITTVSE